MVNQYTLRLMHQVLDLSEFDSITSQLSTVSDVELLLEFILNVRTTCLLELECLYPCISSFSYSATIRCPIQAPKMQIGRSEG